MPDVVINVVDASNLERNLFLTTQLIDMDIRVVMALNMYDEHLKRGDHFDYNSLGKMIGIPIVPTTSSKGSGIKQLFDKVIDVYEDRDPDLRHVHIKYEKPVEDSLKILQDIIWENKAPIIRIYTGSRALQDMNGLIRIVSSLLLRFSIERVAIIAGTLHPNPMISGINDFPCSPILCITLSIIKAALAI
ncbi:hypothetical protein ES705_47126 [subsurface metagenome]